MFEQLIGANCFAERKFGGDHRLDLASGKKIEEFGQIFAELIRVLVAQSFDVVPEGALLTRDKFQQTERGKAQAGGQLPFCDGGACAVTGQGATRAQTTVGSQPVFPTDRVEDAIHTAWCEFRDTIDEIFGAVIDRRGAERGDQRVLRFRGGAEHFEAGDFAELQSGRANTAGGTVNQNALAGANFGDAMKHLESCDVIEDEADCFGGIEVLWDRSEIHGGHDCVAGIAPDHGECGDALPDGEILNAVSECINPPHDVVARCKRKWWSFRIEAVTHEHVSVSNSRGQIFHANLPSGGNGETVLDDFKDLGAALGGDDYAKIFLHGE